MHIASLFSKNLGLYRNQKDYHTHDAESRGLASVCTCDISWYYESTSHSSHTDATIQNLQREPHMERTGRGTHTSTRVPKPRESQTHSTGKANGPGHASGTTGEKSGGRIAAQRGNAAFAAIGRQIRRGDWRDPAGKQTNRFGGGKRATWEIISRDPRALPDPRTASVSDRSDPIRSIVSWGAIVLGIRRGSQPVVDRRITERRGDMGGVANWLLQIRGYDGSRYFIFTATTCDAVASSGIWDGILTSFSSWCCFVRSKLLENIYVVYVNKRLTCDKRSGICRRQPLSRPFARAHPRGTDPYLT